jgi:hypothetical protein
MSSNSPIHQPISQRASCCWHKRAEHHPFDRKYYGESAMSQPIIGRAGFKEGFIMRLHSCIRWTATALAVLLLSWPAFSQETDHYTRFRDAKWYARQIQPLREEVAKIDNDLRTLLEARKSGKGVTDAVAMDQEPEGVTSEGQTEVLRKRRVALLRQIDALEEQARHNEIVPGDLRKDYGPEEPTTSDRKPNRAEKDIENALTQEKEHLEHARKDADLLQRDQKLKAQQEYSNPEPGSRRQQPSELLVISTRLVEKQAEVQDAEQKVTDLEDRLEDLRRNAAAEGESKTDAIGEGKSANPERERGEKDEAYWRKQFAEIDYKIRTAQTERDILQRELNMGLVQYDPNPATAMKESITRNQINEHRKAIEDKKKELMELKKQRDDLEDALRHAGGPAGWGRE